MHRPGRLAVALVVIAVIAFAQTQVASITSNGPFQLRGANVTPGQGVPSWPVMPGDTIKAGDKPLTIAFQDGSTIDLAPGSSAKVDLSGNTPVFQLESGTAHYSLKTLDAVKLMTLDNSVTPKDLAGSLQVGVGGQNPPAGWWTAGHTTAVVVAAAAAAGLSLGVAQATKKGPPVSPSVCNNGNGNGNGEPACP